MGHLNLVPQTEMSPQGIIETYSSSHKLHSVGTNTHTHPHTRTHARTHTRAHTHTHSQYFCLKNHPKNSYRHAHFHERKFHHCFSSCYHHYFLHSSLFKNVSLLAKHKDFDFFIVTLSTLNIIYIKLIT